MTTHTIIFLGLFELNDGRASKTPPPSTNANEKTASPASRARHRAGLAARHFGYPDCFQLTGPL